MVFVLDKGKKMSFSIFLALKIKEDIPPWRRLQTRNVKKIFLLLPILG